MQNDELEKRLAALALARNSNDYIEKGLDAIHRQQAVQGFWYRRLPLALAGALVLSVTANVFQLVHSEKQIDALESEQLTQCQTPSAAVSPTKFEPGDEIATHGAIPKPIGMC